MDTNLSFMDFDPLSFSIRFLIMPCLFCRWFLFGTLANNDKCCLQSSGYGRIKCRHSFSSSGKLISLAKKEMQKRIIGLDVARALAIIGMTIVNFKIVLGQEEESWLKTWSSIFDGKAAAVFVVLAGLGLALMSKGKKSTEDRRKVKISILKRALFLFALGLVFYLIWPADILHYYGLYMLISIFFLYASSTILLTFVCLLILGYPLLLGLVDYQEGWNFESLEYLDFWTLNGFFRNLFVNGFHPVVPWTAFMLFGLWLGRQDLRDYFFVKKVYRLSGIVFLLIQLSSWSIIRLFAEGLSPTDQEGLIIVFGTAPMPPMPIYMVNGIAIASFVITACILWSEQYRQSPLILRLANMGRLALSLYLAHIIIGMGLVELALGEVVSAMPLAYAILYALLFSLAALLFSDLWMKRRTIGPLEWIMRRLTR